MRIIVGCEFSQVVTMAFREKGHEAYSCDIIPCEGGHPEWHIQDDILEVLKREKFDMGIFHPPCTYLTVTGNKWFLPQYQNRFPDRLKQRQEAIDFFMKLANLNIHRIAIENPIGIMSTTWRKPEQIIQPYYFGDAERKSTCLWLKNLPKLTPTNIVEPRLYAYADGRTDGMWHMETMKLPPNERAKLRSKTFPGIAEAMAEQWNFS